MIKLKDGPAAGSYAVKRAPLYLRAVVSTKGAKDVLDQVDDTPAEGESVFVYRRIGDASTVHVNMGRIKRGTGFYAMAEYEWMEHVAGDSLRATQAWQQWVDASP